MKTSYRTQFICLSPIQRSNDGLHQTSNSLILMHTSEMTLHQTSNSHAHNEWLEVHLSIDCMMTRLLEIRTPLKLSPQAPSSHDFSSNPSTWSNTAIKRDQALMISLIKYWKTTQSQIHGSKAPNSFLHHIVWKVSFYLPYKTGDSTEIPRASSNPSRSLPLLRYLILFHSDTCNTSIWIGLAKVYRDKTGFFKTPSKPFGTTYQTNQYPRI